MGDPASEPLLIGARDAARRLGCGRDSAYELIRTGRLRAVKIGRRLLVPRSELDAFVERELGYADPSDDADPSGGRMGRRGKSPP